VGKKQGDSIKYNPAIEKSTKASFPIKTPPPTPHMPYAQNPLQEVTAGCVGFLTQTIMRTSIKIDKTIDIDVDTAGLPSGWKIEPRGLAWNPGKKCYFIYADVNDGFRVSVHKHNCDPSDKHYAHGSENVHYWELIPPKNHEANVEKKRLLEHAKRNNKHIISSMQQNGENLNHHYNDSPVKDPELYQVIVKIDCLLERYKKEALIKYGSGNW
jgi:hypothetical protein